MNDKQYERMHTGKGFIAALDQSGGSTPKALKNYGIEETEYHSDEEMFNLIHQMRSRVITSPAFTSEHILAAILFQRTMESKIEGKMTADYLWEEKGIVPILKVDKGLAPLENGVQLMKPIPDLDETLKLAVQRHIFGTKMRSVIKAADKEGIRQIVDQQFAFGTQIGHAGLIPILEPEVDIHIPDKAEAEIILLENINEHLSQLPAECKLMFKLSIPTKDGYYTGLMNDPHVVRVVALSGGYSRAEADELLAKNPGLIASFSRALLSDLNAHQTEAEFNTALGNAIAEIYKASID
ncbi:MAG: fructose bisphosphate aldolase [Solobacterium sp.]|jgi:fructose-bisphosphate aldolase class I|nr:fructose bisphosphate aldolase [Solobacterium sp.]MCH4265499.1 fructose bisphosphate aldolase [Solobacterium sp.]